jgi:hypothetical protein
MYAGKREIEDTNCMQDIHIVKKRTNAAVSGAYV